MVLLHLIGGVALLIWGLREIRTNIMRTFGKELRQIIGQYTKHRFYAVLAGFGVTALLQSSSATAMITASFASRKLIKIVPALAIMLGADVGTAVVVQIFSFDIHFLSPLFILTGVVIYMSVKSNIYKYLGRVVLGLGFLLLAIQLILESAEPINQSQLVQNIFESLANEYILSLMLGALLAWISHSSLAAIILAISLTASGVISVNLGVVLALGANVGASIPVLLNTMMFGTAARRIAIGNLIFRVIGCIVFLIPLPWILMLLEMIESDPGRQIANFHLFFNVALLLIFIFLLPAFTKLLKKLITDKTQQKDESHPKHLDHDLLKNPKLALPCAMRETLRIGDYIESMLVRIKEVLSIDSQSMVEEIERLDDIVDSLYQSTLDYLIEISKKKLDDADKYQCERIISLITNLEHIGDIIDKNLSMLAIKKIKQHISLSEEGYQEIIEIHTLVLDNLKLTLSVFMNQDLQLARQLIQSKKSLRDLEHHATEKHLERLRQKKSDNLETSTIQMDIIRDLKRINSHLVSVAYPIIDHAEAAETLNANQ